MNFLSNKVESEEDFERLIAAFLQQNGYDSENSKRGFKSAEKDYEAVFKKAPPAWIGKLWESTALSLLHLAIEAKKELPEEFELPAKSLAQ